MTTKKTRSLDRHVCSERIDKALLGACRWLTQEDLPFFTFEMYQALEVRREVGSFAVIPLLVVSQYVVLLNLGSE